MINGCLYVDEEVISAYYTGEVRFNHETKQVTLEMKDGTEPVVAVKELTADEENGGYSVDVPVIVGLNDANYEKSLNDSLMQQMQDYITAFMAEENTEDSLLQVQVTTGFCTKDFLSILWEGTRNGMPVRFAKNLDLLGQRAVTLADMLTQTSLEAAQAQAGEDWTAEQFYLTADGELILIDAGAQWQWYNGDISRTFPVNGKFTERQKLVYNIVLEGQRRVIDAIRPGVQFSSLNELLKEYYFTALKEIGLVETREDVAKYYYHGVSHYLGAETHDIGRYGDRVLEPGMVLTVEPGLYIEEWEIGIRIEDDVLVTAEGNEVMTAAMLKTVDEIEAFMAKE